MFIIKINNKFILFSSTSKHPFLETIKAEPLLALINFMHDPNPFPRSDCLFLIVEYLPKLG